MKFLVLVCFICSFSTAYALECVNLTGTYEGILYNRPYRLEFQQTDCSSITTKVNSLYTSSLKPDGVWTQPNEFGTIRRFSLTTESLLTEFKYNYPEWRHDYKTEYKKLKNGDLLKVTTYINYTNPYEETSTVLLKKLR